jgi:hypothetical protein
VGSAHNEPRKYSRSASRRIIIRPPLDPCPGRCPDHLSITQPEGLVPVE